MELPANPKNLTYGVYNRRGTDLTQEEEPTPQEMYWALADDSPAPSGYEAPYDMMDYVFG